MLDADHLLFSPGVTGNVVLADDGAAPTSDACTALVNGAQVAGKIASHGLAREFGKVYVG